MKLSLCGPARRPQPLIAALLLVAGLVIASCGKSSGGGDGPLGAGDLSVGHRAEVGEAISFGAVLLFVESGAQPATIERVRLLDTDEPLELIGVRTRRIPSDRGIFVSTSSFPPAGYDSVPLDEQPEVPVSVERTEAGRPIDGLELVIGIRTTRGGVASARAVEVTYRVGDEQYVESYKQSVHLCAPVADYEGGEGCPPEEAKDNFGEGVLG